MISFKSQEVYVKKANKIVNLHLNIFEKKLQNSR